MVALTAGAVEPVVGMGRETLASPAPVYHTIQAKECNVRDGLGHVMAKINAGKQVKVGYIGGSITEMDGWRRLSFEWLQSQYPGCTFKHIAAGIGGTGSSLGVYRFRQDILDYDPDLIFIEFSVNDGGASTEGIWRSFEGMVRQAWAKNPDIDIVFVYTICESISDDYRQGRYYRSAGAVEMLADHFGIPSICFGPRVIADVDSGLLVMNHGNTAVPVPEEDQATDEKLADWYAAQGKRLFSKDGVHPILRAHRCYYLASFTSSWPSLSALPPADHASKLAAPFYDTSLENARTVPLDRGMLAGDWTTQDSPYYEKLFHGKVWYSNTPGSSIKIRFRGERVRLYTVVGPDRCTVRYTIDGVPSSAIRTISDSYSRATDIDLYAGSFGEHDIEIILNTGEWYMGPLLVLGDLDMGTIVDTTTGESIHAVLPSIEAKKVQRTVSVAGAGDVQLNAACAFAPIAGQVTGYDGWHVGFTFSVDRDAAAGALGVYGCNGEDPWHTLASPDVVTANASVRLQDAGWGTKGAFDAMGGMKLGFKALSGDLLGAKVKAEMRIYEMKDGTETGRSAVLASKVLEMTDLTGAASWFDARVADYSDWPDDAALALSGAWSAAPAALDDVAGLASPGELAVDSETPLCFAADRPQTPTGRIAAVTVHSEVDLGVYDYELLPPVNPSWKAGVVVARTGGMTNYYGLASGAWTKLEGAVPSSRDGEFVPFDMTFRESSGLMTVTYSIGGVICTAGGASSLLVAVPGDIAKVSYGGKGALRGLAGSMERRQQGLVLFVTKGD